MKQTIESYSTELKHLIDKSKHQIVILIDSVDKIFDIKDIKWLPLELANNVKIILTVSSDCESSFILKELQSKIPSQNFLLLTPFTQTQWEDVLAFGGGTTNGALQLPESWKKSDERAPIQAKVRFKEAFLTKDLMETLSQILWWLAWLGQRKLENLTISHISEKVFEILECKFGVTQVKYLITLINASRDGLEETEIIELLQSSKIVDGKMFKAF